MQLDFTTKGHASKRGRYVIAESASTHIGDVSNGERVGVGVVPGKDGAALVHEHGATQTAVPLYAVATAVAALVIPADALVSAFAETGNLGALKAAVLKALPDPKVPKAPAAPKAS